jgi:hypothetical protein
MEKLMPYTGDKKLPGAPFPSLGLRLVTPEARKVP